MDVSFQRQTQKTLHFVQGFSFVGVAGFEPTTSSSRTKRATGLRYTPVQQINQITELQN